MSNRKLIVSYFLVFCFCFSPSLCTLPDFLICWPALSQSLPGSMKYLEYLERLLLGANKLRALPHDTGKLHRLSDLWLDNNQLEDLPQSMTNLVSLRKVNLYSTPNVLLEFASPQFCVLWLLARYSSKCPTIT